MRRFMTAFAALALLTGCGIEAAIKRNDDRYMQPGALDFPLTGLYETYQYNFLDKYRVTHQWLNSSNCSYSKLPMRTGRVGLSAETFTVDDIYEEDGVTKQRGAHPKKDFNRFVRSVKRQQPIYAPATKEESEASVAAALERARRSSRTGIYERPPPDTRKPIRHEEIETGFKALCGETWQATNHSLTLYLHKRDLAGWRAIWTERSPKGKWSERRIGANVWHVQETAEQDFEPKLVGFGGSFQTWLLPIGDTGYILALKLSANQESLKYPDAHTRFQATFSHLIGSVKIEPLRP